MHDGILGRVERYYSGRFAEHGATPEGVDWNSSESQEIRFEQLLRISGDEASGFSINDYGCGYGALAEYMHRGGRKFTYRGYDLSSTMLEAAQERLGGADASFVKDPSQLEPADYTVASGIFNVKLETERRVWTQYVLDTIAELERLSNKGFAFNMLTSYSDPEHMRPDLYYGEPGFFFDYCASTISREVALLQDYGLYEFTILVRKAAD
jgi:SAM-dependent methyltransferase